MKTYSLKGQLKTNTNTSLSCLIIEAWDQDVKHNDLLDRTVSKEDGSFELQFNSLDFEDHPLDHSPDVFFRVYQGKQLLLSTENKPMKNLQEQVLEDIVLEINLQQAIAEQESPIKGLALLIGLSKEKALKLTQYQIEQKKALNIKRIQQLVKDKKITHKQGQKLELAYLFNKSGKGNYSVIRTLQNHKFSQLGNKKLSKSEDLVKLDYQSILNSLEEDKALELEQGENASFIAHRLMTEIETRFPSQKLQVAVLPESNQLKNILQTALEGFPSASVTSLFNTYQYLGIENIAQSNETRSQEEKIKQIQTRVQSVGNFFESNKSFNILSSDLTKKGLANYNFGDISDELKTGVIKTLKSFQRTMHLSPNTQVAKSLLASGFDSAHAIASSSLVEFQRKTGMEYSSAQAVYEIAKQKAVFVSNTAINIADYYLDNINIDVLNPNIPDQGELLEELDDYEDFFGNQSSCNCKHCASIFSPAAYFVDLMDFVEEEVTTPNFLGELSNHFLKLKNRRPDLWKLNINCANTHEPIPYLVIINEVLESYLQNRNDWNNNTLYKALSQSKSSFKLPFHLPLEQLNIYLSHFNIQLKEVAELLAPSSSAAQYTQLGLSQTEADIIFNAISNTNVIRRFYDFEEDSIPVDVQIYLNTMGLSRAEFGQLINTKFVQGNTSSSNHPFIELAKEPADSLQFNIEKIQNLDWEHLDRMHRFTRLWKTLNWEMETLDFIAEKFGWDIVVIAKLKQLQSLLGNLNINHLLGIIGHIPTSLFEKTFNISYFKKKDGALPQANTFLIHPALKENSTEKSDPLVHRMLAALQISDQDFLNLIKNLAIPLEMDTDKGFALSAQNLTLLFQEAYLAKALNLGIDEFILLKKILGITQLEVGNLESIQQFLHTTEQIYHSKIDIVQWYKLLFPVETEQLEKALEWRNQILEVITKQELKIDENSNLTTILNSVLPEVLGIEESLLVPLFELLKPIKNKQGLLKALATQDTDKVLLKFLLKLPEWQFIISELTLEAIDLTFIAEHPALFELTSIEKVSSRLNHRTLILLNSYMDIKQNAKDAIVAFQNVLSSPSSDWGQVAVDLSKLTELSEDYLQLLIQHIQLPVNEIEAFVHLQKVISLSQTLGINGESLNLLLSTSYDDLELAAEAIIAAFNTKYDTEKALELSEPLEDKLNEAKRSALSDYMIHVLHPEFNETQDLYYYFLLDTELSGCARSSRIVAANASLQLYIQRCLMNLEKDQAGLLMVSVDEEAKTQWQWRKNYRVWEANRKVFLFPENYILPELRDNKSEPFLNLEKELLQQDVTDASVTDSYLKYLEEVAKLSNLRIAGSLRQGNTLYLLGRTTDESPEWHYRTFNILNKTFGSWRKIDAPINAAYASPIIYLGTLHIFWYEVTTQPHTSMENGNSTLIGYKHKISLNYTSILADGSWKKTTKIPFPNLGGKSAEGMVYDNLTSGQPNWDDKVHHEVDENYSLRGILWDRPYLSAELKTLYLHIPIREGYYEVSLFKNKIAETTHKPYGWYSDISFLSYNIGTKEFLWQEGSGAKGVAYYKTYDIIQSTAGYGPFFFGDYSSEQPEIHPINHWPSAYILIYKQNSYLLFYNENNHVNIRDGYIRLQLNSSLPNKYKEILFLNSLDELISIETQQGVEEYEADEIEYSSNASVYEYNMLFHEKPKYDLSNSFGIYFQELFFHIPFLIANSLNASQDYEAAYKWYQYIFDPSAIEKRKNSKEIFMYPYDRVWQYLGFIAKDIENLRDILTGPNSYEAIENYETDPFSPHAIARLRLNTYQKTIVMRFIDNLLDWGDQLFSMDTMESINEASLLYTMAYDILGKRPAILGDCESEGNGDAKYENVTEGNEFIKSLETVVLSWHIEYSSPTSRLNADDYIDWLPGRSKYKKKQNSVTGRNAEMMASPELSIVNNNFNYTGNTLYNIVGDLPSNKLPQSSVYANIDERFKNPSIYIDNVPNVVIEATTKYSNLFCVPYNDQLLEYWDRVEDRLYKIRNCMNIKGISRQLALFQPPIDPMMLVRAKAAGLSIQDVLMSLSTGDSVMYKFSFLLDLAKSFAAKVQTFGSALMGALEKRDAEALALIRNEQQQNLQQLSTLAKEKRLTELKEVEQSLTISKNKIQAKMNHFDELIDEEISTLEAASLGLKYSSGIVSGVEQVFRIGGSISFLIPNLGSPFAITYGGKQVGESANAWSDGFRSLAGLLNTASNIVSQEASYQRRLDNWEYQRSLFDFEMEELEKQIIINEIRQQVAKRDLEIHQQSIEYTEETYNFLKDKFGNKQLYTWLASELQGMYRQAYQMAVEYANMAQTAYQFERDEDSTIYIQGSNWDSSKAGLLAGQRLMMQLDQLEKTYLISAERDMEVRQSFSLRMLDPKQLLELQETGSCEIDIPELAFDLVYPGQYNRRLRSMTITIPCVTGPYTNVNATLTMLDNSIRLQKYVEADIPANHTPVPGLDTVYNITNQIALSGGESDSGLLFMDFHNNKYLPFEGAGAISKWKLEFPSEFRQFDYSTISDVIVTLAYTAKYDGVFKTTVETSIKSRLQNQAEQVGATQYINLKQHFSSELRHLLLRSPHETTINIDERIFPYYLRDRKDDIRAIGIKIIVEKPKALEWNDCPISLTIDNIESAKMTFNTANTFIAEDDATPTDLAIFDYGPLNGQDPLKEWTLQLSSTDEESKMDDWIDNIHILIAYRLNS